MAQYQLPDGGFLSDDGSVQSQLPGGAFVVGVASLSPVVVTPGVGTVALTGYAPSLLGETNIDVPVGTVTVTGYAPALVSGNTVSVPVGSIALTGYAPTFIRTVPFVISTIDYINGLDIAVVGIFIYDTFTGTNGTQLSAHTPEIGGGWYDAELADFNSGDPGPEIQSNAIVTDNLGAFTGTFSTATPAQADYSVEASIVAGPAAFSHSATIYARVSNATATGFSVFFAGYAVQFGYDGGFGWRLILYKQDTGGGITNVTLDTYVPTVTPGNTYVVRVELVGSSIVVKLDGVTRISETDGDHSLPGSVGVAMYGATDSMLELTAEYL